MQHDAHHFARMTNKHVSSIPSLPLNKDCKPCLMFFSVDCCRRSFKPMAWQVEDLFLLLQDVLQDRISSPWRFGNSVEVSNVLWFFGRSSHHKMLQVEIWFCKSILDCPRYLPLGLQTLLLTYLPYRYEYIYTYVTISYYIFVCCILFDSPRFRPRLPLQLLRLFQRWMLWVVEQSWETWPNWNMVLMMCIDWKECCRCFGAWHGLISWSMTYCI